MAGRRWWPQERGPVTTRTLGLVGLLLLLTGCAGAPGKESGPSGDDVPRPEWRVGDRWVFRRTTLAGAVTVVTHQVVATSGDGYIVRVQGPSQEITSQWTSDLHLARLSEGGGATARFEPAAMFFTWPLKLGKSWTQEFAYADGRSDGRYSNTWKVGPLVEPVDVVAGRFYTVRVERWGGPGMRLATYWYNARVRYWVRLEDYQRGYVDELVEFQAWGS